MNLQTYREQLRKAHREELLGHAISVAVCARFGEQWPQHADMKLLGELEAVTAQVLEPIIQRHGIVAPPPDEIQAEAQASAEQVVDWAQLMAFFRSALPPIVTTFDAMAAFADEHDREAMRFLAIHEQALLDFAEAEGQPSQRPARQHISSLIASGTGLVRRSHHRHA